MPQSVMRKAQPFTIGTKLSLPKYPVVGTLDSGPLPLNERVSQYLAQACPTGHTYASQCASPTGTVSEHCVLARSIRKITLSSPRSPPSGEAVGVHQQYSRGNYNNNNSRALRDGSPRALCQWAVPIPRISGGEDLRPDCFKSLEPPCLVLQRPSAQPSACSRNDLMGRRPTGLEDGVTQLSQDIIQAQMWVRGRLRDLTDTCDVASLPDGDQRAQTTQKDMALFEDTIVKLNQKSEYFCKGETESAHSIRLQLQALRDQWQLLKQTLTNQKRALGGAKALQEFNKKADELEMWMREKEEKPSMSLLLDENNDKIQLTRRILDLKQEQLHYRNLQENINSLAQKLEKQGRMESKAASNRRKQLNKMWLRLQETLLEHQQTLQLALEAATLWQQADSILRAMEGQKSMSVVSNGEDLKGIRDRELRDIASQIMILDVTVSQVSSLHPVLASKANQKQRQVKECWAQLQESLRADKTPRTNGGCTFSREPCSPPLPVQSSMRIKQQEFLGGLSAVPQNGTTSGKAGNKKNKEEFKYGGPVPKVSGVISGHAPELKSRRDNYLEQREGLEQEESLGGESTEQNTEETWVLGELTSTEQWLQSLECLISEPAVLQNPETIRQDLKKVSVMERELKSRALALHSLLAKARGPAEQNMREGMKGKIQEVEERFQMVREALQRRVSDLRDTLVLSEFMEIVQKEENRRKKQKLEARGSPAHGSDGTGMEREDRFTPLEELQEAVEMLNDAAKEREKTLALTREMEKLRELLSAVSESVEAAQKRLDELRKETEERESGFAMVKSRAELKDLQEVFIQQKQLEANISGLLRLEVRQLEEQVTRMQELCPEKTQMIGRNVKETLGAWTQLQNGVQGNNSRMQRASQLRRFFQSYLDMISWTEETRSQIFLENPGEKVTLTWREELERRIEEKLKEFEELASIGWKFIGEEHFLAQTIKERLEELQGMLSWVLMRWRCQKKQKTMENKTEWRRSKDKQDSSQVPQEEPSNRHQMAIIPPEAFEKLQSKGSRLTSIPTKGPTLRRYGRKTHSPMSLEQHLCLLSAGSQRESPLGAELLEETSRSKCSEGPLWLEPRELPSAAGTVEEHAEHHMHTRKLDFQLMEGPLERKHILQQGGKKASCRTWTMHYAVLVRRTLCFYSDKKFSSKSSVSAPPLHLTGATCYPDSAYTKRGNCFRLQLADGSEYLLQAPSSSFRQEWVSKLQQNAGLKETDLLGDKILGQEFSPHLASRVGSLSPRRADLCQRAAGMIKGVKDKKELPDNESEGNRMPSHPTSSHWPEELPGESARLTHSSQWDSDIANRRRSRSFSAVTYQKVPGKETTPSYSVTLYISESAAPRGRCHSFATSPEECRPLIGLGKEEFHIGDPKPRQSVFRKFFRKKE